MRLASFSSATALLLCVITAAAQPSRTYSSDEDKFTPDATVRSEYDGRGARLYLMHAGTFQGVPYKFFPGDGSGKIGHWSLQCQQDIMDDSRNCTLTVEGLGLNLDSKGAQHVGIGFKHRPGSQVAIRIDGGKPIVVDAPGWSGAAARSIIEQLLRAQSVATRYVQWPHEGSTDTIVDVAGLAQAIALARWALQAK